MKNHTVPNPPTENGSIDSEWSDHASPSAGSIEVGADFLISLETTIIEVLKSLDFHAVGRLKAGLLFSNSALETGLIVDIGVCSNQVLEYIDYTREQNELMARYRRLVRFAVESPSDVAHLMEEVDVFLKEHDNNELPEIVKRGREETHPDPTHPEQEFETLFSLSFGETAMYALRREKSFTDFEGKIRYIDYALFTRDRPIAIELNGESFHHPRCIGVNRYRSQLFKQNSLVMGGWKVYRWSLRGMQDAERFIEEMRDFFGPVGNFRQTPHYLASRQLDVLQLMEHQAEALDKIQEDRNAGRNAFLLLLPTGTGKTEIFIEDFRRLKVTIPPMNGLILVPTSPLRAQVIERLALRLPEYKHGTAFQDRNALAGFMVQTYQYMIRHFEDFKSDAFDYIVVDEAHHAAAPGLKTVIEHFHPGTLIGATATDKRLDAKPLEEIFGVYETGLSLQDAIGKGLLPPIRAFRVQSNVDLSNVRYNGADYVQSDLQRTLLVSSRDEIVADVLERYFGTSPMGMKQGVVFCVSVRHAKAMSNLLNQRGISSAAVSGEDRDGAEAAVAAYRRKEFRFLCACNLLTEGWDSPQTSVLVMARPTMSKVLYVQQLGRGTRPHPGKEALYVLDVVDRYGPLNSPWSVHSLFSISQYQPWMTLVGSGAGEDQTEQTILLNCLHEEERKITEINIFTFQKQYENYLNEEQLARELFISTGTVKSWLRKGEIKADVELPFGVGVLRYFAPGRVDFIRETKNLRVHDETTQYQDFFEFLKERDYTFSYKMIFLLSILTCQNSRGEAKLDDLERLYRGFYEDRIHQQLPADRENSPCNNSAFLADAAGLTKSILANPFEKFERKRFMHHCKDLAYIAWNSGLWKRLHEDKKDIEAISRQMVEDLRKYYEALQGLGDTAYLCRTHPGVARHFESTDITERVVVPMAEYDEQAAFRTVLPYYKLQVAAGQFLEGDAPEPDGWVDVEKLGFRQRLSKGMFVSRVVGKSMEPTIRDGSLCVFRHPVEGTREGRVVLVQKRNFTDPETGGGYTVKRYHSTKSTIEDNWRHETIELIPDNPDRVKYPVLKFTSEDDTDLQTRAEFVAMLAAKK